MSRSSGRIGWFLVWAIVFCDIGTSVYYVPGLLYTTTGEHAGFFVLLTTLAFVLLCVKVVEVTRRFSGGGGVVSVADEAFGPWWGCLGGQMIMVDYYLTAAISAASGAYYIDSVWSLGGHVLGVTLAGLAMLGVLNVIGIRESARASMVLAIAAFVVDVIVIGVCVVRLPVEVLAQIPEEFVRLGELNPGQLLVGYAGAWLAFSGLESLSQLAPAMRDLGATPRRGMIAVVTTVLITAPMLISLRRWDSPRKSRSTRRSGTSLNSPSWPAGRPPAPCSSWPSCSPRPPSSCSRQIRRSSGITTYRSPLPGASFSRKHSPRCPDDSRLHTWRLP